MYKLGSIYESRHTFGVFPNSFAVILVASIRAFFGLIPEFIGRFPVIVHTIDLDLDALIKILKEPKNNLIHQMQF